MTTEPRTSPTVWEATGQDVPALAATLARAFYDDPVMSWIFPDEGSRIARLTGMFALLARHAHLPKAGVELASRHASCVEAVALWDPPGAWRLPLGTQIRQGPRFLRVFGARLPAALRALGRVERYHPARPHWYLSVLGTDPSAQGHGLGSALLRSRLGRCDAAGLPAYLESSKHSNIAYYEKHGFRVMRELPMPGGCPPVWPMWRDPR
jgi:ribosomal protein S18 acetylase RimI-like enzyme